VFEKGRNYFVFLIWNCLLGFIGKLRCSFWCFGCKCVECSINVRRCALCHDVSTKIQDSMSSRILFKLFRFWNEEEMPSDTSTAFPTPSNNRPITHYPSDAGILFPSTILQFEPPATG